MKAGPVFRRPGGSGDWSTGKPVKTDPGAAWYDNGQKTFTGFDAHAGGGWAQRRQGLADAIAWARKTFGDIDFVRNRMGDYVARNVNERFPIPKRDRPPRAAIDK